MPLTQVQNAFNTRRAMRLDNGKNSGTCVGNMRMGSYYCSIDLHTWSSEVEGSTYVKGSQKPHLRERLNLLWTSSASTKQPFRQQAFLSWTLLNGVQLPSLFWTETNGNGLQIFRASERQPPVCTKRLTDLQIPFLSSFPLSEGVIMAEYNCYSLNLEWRIIHTVILCQ